GEPADHIHDPPGLDVAGEASHPARDFLLIGSIRETRNSASDARVEVPLGLVLPAIEKKIFQVGSDVVPLLALDSKTRRLEYVDRDESLVRRGRLLHHARKIFIEPVMPHLLGGAVENYEARARRQHAMNFLERRERVRHVMVDEG